MGAALKIKTTRSTKQRAKVARREQGYETATQRVLATCVRTATRVDFPVPSVLADALDSKGPVFFAIGETRIGLDADRRRGVVAMLRREGVTAWLDLAGQGRLCVRWNGGKGGWNFNCGWDVAFRPIVLDGSSEPTTGAVVTSIVRTTVGAFRQAFEGALSARYRDTDRPERRAMRLVPLDSGRGFLLASTDGSRAHYAALPASGSLKTSPIIPAAMADRVAGMLHGIPDVAPLSLVRSTGDDSRTVLEIRVAGCRVAEYVTDNDARFPTVGKPLAQARELSGTATVRLSYAMLADAIGKKPKQENVVVSWLSNGIRISMSDPGTGDATVDVDCGEGAALDRFPSTGFFPRYLLDALLACGGGEGCEVRFAADPCGPCLVRGKKGMAVVMPKRIK